MVRYHRWWDTIWKLKRTSIYLDRFRQVLLQEEYLWTWIRLRAFFGIYFSCDETGNAVPYTFASDYRWFSQLLFIFIEAGGKIIPLSGQEFSTEIFNVWWFNSHVNPSKFYIYTAVREIIIILFVMSIGFSPPIHWSINVPTFMIFFSIEKYNWPLYFQWNILSSRLNFFDLIMNFLRDLSVCSWPFWPPITTLL